MKFELVEWLKQRKCLPSKCEALSSNPSVAKKKKKKFINIGTFLEDGQGQLPNSFVTDYKRLLGFREIVS
jgi:hypothetical protein